MSSRYSFDSLDHLWADERRLSEAGVRRYSIDSNSLNDSTDSFIIGDRVFVRGNIPGKIAYIGETKFGPGDWAGIVLDEAGGKNDGTVGGFRYFQCEPKHGIFSRLHRLTRSPIYGNSPVSRNSSVDEGRASPPKKSSNDGLYSSRKSSTEGGLFSRGSPDYGHLFSRKYSGDSYSGRKSSGGTNYVPMTYDGRTISPGRDSPQQRHGHPPEGTPHHYGGSPQNMYDQYHEGSSPPTRKKSQKDDLKLGDRVIIQSSQGSKSGVLKYKGRTYFADGEWCGVELEDPLGKNDGSVDGHRYFDCTNKFGVFAPLGKVSKSPVQGTGHAGKNCAVHPDKDIPIVSTIVKEVKPAPGSRPFMDKTTTTVYEKKAPRGVQPVTQIHQIKGYNHAWDADCY